MRHNVHVWKEQFAVPRRWQALCNWRNRADDYDLSDPRDYDKVCAECAKRAAALEVPDAVP